MRGRGWSRASTAIWPPRPPSCHGTHSPPVGSPAAPATIPGDSRSPKAQLPPCPIPFSYWTNEGLALLPIHPDRLAVSCTGICSCQKN